MQKENIKKNYLYNLIFEVVVVIYPLIITPYLSRVLLPEGIGIKSYTYAIMSYFYYLGMLGIDIYGQKEIAAVKEDRIVRSKKFSEIYLLKLITMGLAIVLYLLFVFFTQVGNEYKKIYLCWLFFLFDAMISVKWYVSGIDYFKQLSFAEVLSKLISIVAIFVLIKSASDLYKYIIILGFVPLFSDLLVSFFIKKTLVKIPICQLNVFHHLKGTAVYFIPTIASALYSTIDKAMLTQMVGETENGFYEQANKMIILSYTIVSALFTVLRSSCCYLAESEDEASIENYQIILYDYFHLTLLLCIPLAFGIFGISKDFVPFFFGDNFLNSISVLRFLSPLIILMSISQFINSTIIIPKKRVTKVSVFYFVAAGLNGVLNFFLIPRLKANGAALASVISELFLMIVFLFFSRNEIGLFSLLRFSYKYIISGLFMLFVILLFSYYANLSLWLKVIIEIFVGVIVYFGFLIMIKDSYLKGFLKKAISKFRKK